MRLLATRLSAKGRLVTVISLAELLWQAIDENEGIEAVGALERERGFEAAQEQVNTYLSDDDFIPLPRLVAERLNALDPQRDLAFLVRAASLAPAVYHISKLLDELQGRTRVPTVHEGDVPLRPSKDVVVLPFELEKHVLWAGDAPR